MTAGGRVCLGIVTGAHGIKGWVRIKTFTAAPEAIARYGPLEDESGARRIELELKGAAKGVILARIAGVDDRTAAEALKGLRLYVARAALPEPDEDEYYHADLIGLAVVLGDGRKLGRVKAVHDFGAGDSLEIERETGGTVLLPFTRAAVPVVDIAGGRLVAEPPPGFFAEPEASGEEAESGEG